MMGGESTGSGRRLRGLARRWLPSAVRRWIKRSYYPRVLRRFSPDQWPSSRWVQRLVRPGDHVVDAGANIGYVTLLLSRMVGDAGRVYAAEPVPETFDLLSRNMGKLGITNVVLFPYGLSLKEGEGVMEIPEYEEGGDNPYEAHVVAGGGAGRGGRAVAVRLRTLDGLLREHLDDITFVKVDVEGHELQVLMGAGQLIEQSRPAFLIEVQGDPDAQDTPSGDLFAYMEARGYKPFVPQGNELLPRAAGDLATDYFFLLSEHVRMLSA